MAPPCGIRHLVTRRKWRSAAPRISPTWLTLQASRGVVPLVQPLQATPLGILGGDRDVLFESKSVLWAGGDKVGFAGRRSVLVVWAIASLFRFLGTFVAVGHGMPKFRFQVVALRGNLRPIVERVVDGVDRQGRTAVD